MASSSTPPSAKRAAEIGFDFDSPAPKAAKEAAKPTFNKECVPVSHFARDGMASFRIEFTQYKEVKMPVANPDEPPETVWQVKKTFPIPAGIVTLVDAVNDEFANWRLAETADFDPNVATYRGNTARLTLLVAQPKDVNKVFQICNKHGLFTNDFSWQNSYREWLGRSHAIEYKITLSTIHVVKVPNILQGCLSMLGGMALASNEWSHTAKSPAEAEKMGQEIEKLGKKFGLETEKLPWSARQAHTPSCPSASHAILSHAAQNLATRYLDATTICNTMARSRMHRMMITPTVPVARMGHLYGISVQFCVQNVQNFLKVPFCEARGFAPFR